MFDLDIDVGHILHALPMEAVEMSRSGNAYGYDVFRFGEKWEREDGEISPVALASRTGVERLFLTDDERKWVNENGISAERRRARTRIIDSRRWAAWHEVPRINHDFLMSLIWIPEDMYSPLEILARMGE